MKHGHGKSPLLIGKSFANVQFSMKSHQNRIKNPMTIPLDSINIRKKHAPFFPWNPPWNEQRIFRSPLRPGRAAHRAPRSASPDLSAAGESREAGRPGRAWEKKRGRSNLPPNLVWFDQHMSKWPWISVSLSFKLDLTQIWICLRMYPKSLTRASQTFQYWFGEWLELNLKCREGGPKYSRKLDQAVLERSMSSIDAGNSFTEQNRIL